MSGSLQWNTNGTLKLLSLADPFNAGGSHDCSFGYDDLGRIVSDACATNLAANGDFESGTTDWWQFGAGTFTVWTGSGAENGVHYRELVFTNYEGGFGENSSGSYDIPVSVGQVINYGGWIKRVSGTGNAWWQVAVRDSTGAVILYCPGVGIGDGSSGTTWTYYGSTCTVPTNGASVSCYAQVHGGTDSDHSQTDVYFDDSSVSAGNSLWSQAFSYDVYNNLTKAGSMTWNPGYNASNNHYTASGTTYDNSGNLTKDPFHTYTWNGYNKMASVDSSTCGTNGECVTYDAMGRAVEISNGSAYTEIWYTQLGKTAYMNGSTINYAYAPAPGVGTALISGNGSSFSYLHKDWLGNSPIPSGVADRPVTADQSFAPYGEIYDQFGSTATKYQMFTGDTQDVVAGMMDTPNREYNSAAQGRWLSPDPAGAGWNQYAYATNPLSYVDPLGLGNCDSSDPTGCFPGPWDGGGGGSGAALLNFVNTGVSSPVLSETFGGTSLMQQAENIYQSCVAN